MPFGEMLCREGVGVSLYSSLDEVLYLGFGMINPSSLSGERDSQRLPSDLGHFSEEKFLFLGAPDMPLEDFEGCWLSIEGVAYYIATAQKVRVGNVDSHWRCVLYLKEELT